MPWPSHELWCIISLPSGQLTGLVSQMMLKGTHSGLAAVMTQYSNTWHRNS